MSLLTRRSATASAIILFAVALSAAGCAPETDAAEVGQAQVLAWLDAGASPLLLDVRTPQEYASGHLPGAVNIPNDQLASRVGEIDADRGEEIVVYCERGGRAARAAETLAATGFTRIRHLTGDMSGWRDAGLPVE